VDEEVDTGLGACLQRVEVAGRAGHRRVVAVEDGEEAVVGENPGRLRQGELGLGNVAERRVEDGNVERPTLERKRTCVALDERQVRKVPRELSALLDEDRRRVDADHIPDAGPGCQCPCHRPRAAAHLGNACAGRKGDVGEVRLAHLPLLRVARPQLEDVDEPRYDSGVRVGDGGVDVRQAGPLCSSPARVRP
jgi:hypothetical protein